MKNGENSRASIVGRLRTAGCVFAEQEAEILLSTGETGTALERLVSRRVDGMPLEHVVGWAEFCGLRVAVDDGVFVPRRRSEFLAVSAARSAAESTSASPNAPVCVVDLCCGAGALGMVAAHRVASVELHSSEIDPAAVRCARRNVEPLGGEVHRGDLFDALPAHLRGRVQVLIVNAPYVPTGEIGLMPAEARLHEALVALDGGGDGLVVLRRVLDRAAQWLAEGGHLLMECAQHQALLLLEDVAAAGFTGRVEEDDDLGATIVTGIRR